MKTLRNALVLSVLTLAGLTVPAPHARADVTIDFDTYAAVAYSPATGKYGYAWNHRSRYLAERAALSKCPAADARVVGWVKGGWLVLAVGDNNAYGTGWEYGVGATNVDAYKRALRQCLARANKVVTVVVLCSGNVAPRVLHND